MPGLKDHPFAETWWMKGVAPGAKLLVRAGMLDVAKGRPIVLALVAALCLWRGGVGHEYERFFAEAECNKHLRDDVTRALLTALSAAEELARIEKEGMSEKEMEAHVRKCKNPHCHIRKILRDADKLAKEALGLQNP